MEPSRVDKSVGRLQPTFFTNRTLETQGNTNNEKTWDADTYEITTLSDFRLQ